MIAYEGTGDANKMDEFSEEKKSISPPPSYLEYVANVPQFHAHKGPKPAV